MSGELYGKRFYQYDKKSAASAAKILAHLWPVVAPASIIDIGCGHGIWLKQCAILGAKKLVGVDGEWVTQSQMLDERVKFVQKDLNQKIDIDEKFELAISLEVAEHLEAENSEKFINSLTRLSDTILFGAAYIGQDGTGHINTNRHSCWGELFRKLDYKVYDLIRPLFWGDGDIHYWYRQNCFLYVRSGSKVDNLLGNNGLLDLKNLSFQDAIHPELYELKMKNIIKPLNGKPQELFN